MGLSFKTSKWLDRLWSEHLEVSEAGRQFVKEGVKKQGERFAGFPADLHARLYLPSDPKRMETEGPEWAEQLHSMATELQEWHQLKMMTARNGFAAGIAAEVMLEQLLPHVPDPPPAEPRGSNPDNLPQEGGENQNNESDNQQQDENEGEGDNGEYNFGGTSTCDSDMRSAIRRASRKAKEAINDAESGLEGLDSSLGFGGSGAGTETIQNAGPANLKAIREAHGYLQSSDRLRRIAQLAGRMERVAASKAKSNIKPGVGEIHGIELGNDISRLLPSELMNLRHPRLKLLLLAKLQESRALTYGMTGREPQGKGPIVVLLDESGSMTKDEKDIWSKAVCLSLLGTATRQKRAWHLIAFNGDIVREVFIPPSKANPLTIQNALDNHCSGGTDFDKPILRAVEIIKTSKVMRKADVVLITDGLQFPDDSTVEAAKNLTHMEGVSWYLIGVGPHAEMICSKTLGDFATSIHAVKHPDEDAEIVAPVVNLAC